MTRTISAEGEDAIVQWEGEVLHPYDDFDPAHRIIKPGDRVRGTLTAGVGHTGPDVRPGMTVTRDQSRAWLRADLAASCAVVDQAVKVPLNDNQFAALVSFCFNVGADNFRKSTLLKKLNAGDYAAVPGELAKWVKSKGKTMPGLVNRRAQEAALFGKGSFVSSAYVDAKPAAPPVVDKETVTWGAGILATLGAVFSGSGPVQWALAGVIVVAFGVGAVLFIRKRVFAK